jgi:hypothetical protein
MCLTATAAAATAVLQVPAALLALASTARSWAVSRPTAAAASHLADPATSHPVLARHPGQAAARLARTSGLVLALLQLLQSS